MSEIKANESFSEYAQRSERKKKQNTRISLNLKKSRQERIRMDLNIQTI